MDFKTFWKESKIAFVIKMCLLAAVAAVILALIAVGWLKLYTHHGDEVVVPNLQAMYIDEADILARAEGLYVQIVDSTYTKKVPLGSIMEQKPVAGSRTKNGRPIYVIINAKQVRQIPLPSIREISYRQAEATLHTVGLNVKEVVWEPSIYRNMVLDVRYQGKSIEAGTRLGEGEKVVLVVGQGNGTEQVIVPNLFSKTQNAARESLMGQRLTLGGVFYDVEPDGNEQDYVVYRQSKNPGEMITEGSRVDIYLTTDREKALNASSETHTDEFFD